MVVTKQQKEILDYLRDYTGRLGYAPTLAEIGRHFRLTSLATVHKHLKNLERKRLTRRQWNRRRALELSGTAQRRLGMVDLPLLGIVAAGPPIDAIASQDTLPYLKSWFRERMYLSLKVKGDTMIDEQSGTTI